MKKIFCYLLLLIPWLFNLFIILFNEFNMFSIFYLSCNLTCYLLLNFIIYKIVDYNLYDKNLILLIILVYIFNQFYNISIFYFSNLLLIFFLFILLNVSYFLFFKTLKNKK